MESCGSSPIPWTMTESRPGTNVGYERTAQTDARAFFGHQEECRYH